MGELYQIQKRVLLNFHQYQRLEKLLHNSYNHTESYYMLTYRFGSFTKNTGDLRLRWSGESLNMWDTCHYLNNERNNGDITSHTRPRQAYALPTEDASRLAMILRNELGVPTDPWWVKYVQKFKLKQDITASLQDMWGAQIAFRYILETYILTKQPTQEHHNAIQYTLNKFQLKETPQEIYSKSTAHFVAHNTTTTVQQEPIPTSIRNRPLLDDHCMESLVTAGVIPVSYLECI